MPGSPAKRLAVGDGERHVLHRQGGETDKPVRMGLVGLGKGVVVGLGEAPREFAIAGPIGHGLRQRQGLNLDTLAVHVLDAGIQVDKTPPDRTDVQQADIDDRPRATRFVKRCPEVPAFAGHEL